MAKKKKLNFIDERQLELLKKYYPIDDEKRIVSVKMYYEKATDMLDFSVGEDHHEMLKSEVLEKITEISDKIPPEYKLDVTYIVEDYEGYKANQLMEKFNDAIQLNNYQVVREKKKNWAVTAILIIIGFLLLLLLGTLKEYDWIKEELKKNVLEEMLDITSWVFIWQAVTVAFLTPSEYIKLGVKLISRINSLTFSNCDNEKLVTEEYSSFINELANNSKFDKYKSLGLLITSTIILAVGFYTLLDCINDFIILFKAINTEGIVFLIIFEFLFSFLTILNIASGLLGILLYKGKIKSIKIPKILSIVLFIYNIIILALYIIFGYYDDMLIASLSTLNIFINFISILFYTKKKK